MNDTAAKANEFHLVTLDLPRLEITDRENATSRMVGSGKSLALITFLAFAPRRTASRDTLCDLLWSDRNLNQSRPLLRQTLWLIKTQIQPDLVHADSDSVSLSPAVTSDADAFVSAIERDDLSGAVTIYSKDFFTGYGAPGAGRFEEWANSERVRLRGLFLHSAETLGRRALNCGRSQDAIALARRIRSADPNGQAGWRLQLEARIAAGDAIGAHADADHLEDWLRAEEWEPEPETLAAIRAARRVSEPVGAAAHANELIAELVGRENEFSLIHEAWLATKSDGARFIHIVGESGLGKTRLVRDIGARIRASRGKVRYVRANFAERSIPFSFAAAIAESLASAPGAGGIAPSATKTLVSLNPTLSSRYSVPSGETEGLEPLRVGLALFDLMSSVADDDPVAIALDDLHWCDPQSRDALTVAASRLHDEQILLISSSRLQYSAAPLRPESPVVRLARLSCDDVTALLSSLARLPETSLADSLPRALSESTAGIPLRLLEALHFCIDAHLLIRSNEQWSCPDSTALLSALDASATIERRLALLSVAENELLSLIGFGGMPMPRSLIIEASGQHPADAERTIASLEVRGLVVTENDAWAPAHDSVAEALAASTDSEAGRTLHSRLGTSMLASPDAMWRKRALPHLAEAARWKEIAAEATPLLKNHGTNGEDVRTQLASFVGLPASSEAVAAITRELPLRVRSPRLVRRATMVAIPVLAVVAAFALSVIKESAPPSGTVLALLARTPNGNTDISEVRLDINRWAPGSPIRFGSSKRVSAWLGDANGPLIPRPGARSWAIYKVYPDSGDGEVALMDVNGKHFRVTHSPHDDRPRSFSPDGKRLLFLTTRWNRNGWSDVGIIDLATRHVQRVSAGVAKYENPAWSPDGTRLAFNGPEGLCIADSDGSHTRCPPVPAWNSASELGWVDDHRLLIQGRENGPETFRAIFDVDIGTVTKVELYDRTNVSLDPTGAWALRAAGDDHQLENQVFPSTRLDLSRPILRETSQQTKVVFIQPELSGSFLDSLAIVPPREPLAPGIPHALKAAGWTRDRNVTTPRVTRWRSIRPDIATIDSLGILLGRKPGFAVIELSAGGWRLAVDTFEIRSRVSGPAVDEQWSRGVNERWRFFGKPLPQIFDNGGRTVLSINGDDSFFSGVYGRTTSDARDGLAMDVDLSTPINRTQWQLIIASITPFNNERHIERWDHKTGYITGFFADQLGCSFYYPAGEGKGSTTAPPWYPGMLRAMANPLYRIDTGGWYHVRMQIFPDGRCGTAVNGRAVMISQGRGPVSIPVLATIQGMSVDTKILVGRVKFTPGVPRDVDWTGLTYDGYSWLLQPPPGAH